MPPVTPARWAKAVATVEAGLEQCIAVATEQATGYRNLLFALKGVDPVCIGARAPQVSSAPAKPVGKRPAAGSLPARILDIIGEQDDDQVTFAQILAGKPGAPDETVRYNLYRLVKAGWIVATGNTSQRRYSLPTKKGGR